MRARGWDLVKPENQYGHSPFCEDCRQLNYTSKPDYFYWVWGRGGWVIEAGYWVTGYWAVMGADDLYIIVNQLRMKRNGN